jgi:hypothetical protein
MKVFNLSPGDRFLIENQYKNGEFEYLGENVARHINSNQSIKFNGHTLISLVFLAETGNEYLLK